MKINIRKIKGFLHRHRWAALLIGAAVLVSAGTIYYNYTKGNPFNPGEVLKPKPKEQIVAPLTGLPIDPALKGRRPLAVVIENSPDARPQSGYNEADVVYEALAEGGITRTLAIFHSKNSNEIGPVRSARPYFIDWLSEFKAIFVHVGGSIDAFDAIAAYKVPDINQFYFGSYFTRSAARVAPHNVYTTSARLYEAAKAAKLETTVSDLKWYPFKKDIDAKDRPQAHKVMVNFSSPLFAVTWNYDPATNDYIRSIAGVQAKDKNSGIAVRAKNIIVQYETLSFGTTRAGEQKVNIGTITSGNGLLVQDGKTINIKWQKTSREGLTKITDESGNEINLNPGQTWIEIVPVGNSVTSS